MDLIHSQATNLRLTEVIMWAVWYQWSNNKRSCCSSENKRLYHWCHLPYPKQHLDQLSHFSTAHSCEQQNEMNHETLVTIGYNLPHLTLAMWHNNTLTLKHQTTCFATTTKSLLDSIRQRLNVSISCWLHSSTKHNGWNIWQHLQQPPPPFYSHYTGEPASASTSS